MISKLLAKNLEALKDKNLANLIQNHVYKNFPLLTNGEKGYNLDYDGKLLHNSQAPLGESQEIFNKSNNNESVIHLIYGLGLGYLFQIASRDSKGKVVVYEPNLDILLNVFSLVDFSEDLKKNNVNIFNDFDKALLHMASLVDQDVTVEILILPSYQEIYKEVLPEQVKKWELAYGSSILDYNFKRDRLHDLTINFANNLSELVNEIPMNLYDNAHKGQTAIIVSAGPTLYENIETLKKYQDNAVIFVVGPALKALISNGIKPDYLCIIEAFDCSRHVEDVDLSDVNIILESYTHPSTHKLNAKNKILHLSATNPINELWSEMIHVDIQKYKTCGTVSFTALDSAVHMGFSKIVLVGQDLAYIDGQCYSKSSLYDELICKYNEEIEQYEIVAKNFDKYARSLINNDDIEVQRACAENKIKDLNKGLYTVKSVNGKMIPTEVGYASFIQHFERYANSVSEDIELINTSLKGAQIDGYKNISLEEVMKDSLKIDKKTLNVNFSYNKNEIIEALVKENKVLKEILSSCEDNVKLASRLLIDFKRNNSLDKDKLLRIRKLIKTNADLNSGLTKRYNLFKFITSKFEMELESYMKKVDEYNAEIAKKVIEKHKEYYFNSKKTIENYITLFERNIGEIK